MLEKYRDKKYAWASAGAILLILMVLVGKDVFLHPGKYLFEKIGDAIKNYYVVAYFVKYNAGLTFTGMNYPFGELALFSDNQPLFSVPLAWINRHVWPVAAYITGSQNLFLFFSMAIGAWFMQRILLRLHLPAWYAAVCAVVIVLMSPQHVQLNFQYALSYSFTLIIPWFLLIKYFESKGKWRWLAIYVVTSLAIGFIHVYYLAINGMFGLGVSLTYALQEKEFKRSAKLFLGAVLPSALFLLFMSSVDIIQDRPQHPTGFFLFRANLEGIFWPHDLFYLPALQKLFPALKDSRQPSYAYAGLAGAFCMIYFVIKGSRYLLRKRFWLIIKPVLPAPLCWSVWPVFGMLCFSLAIPLKYGLEEVVDHLPFLGQFRYLYRFIWMFYYVYAALIAYSFYAFYRWLLLMSKPKIAIGFLFFFLTFWVADAVFFLITHVNTLLNQPVGYHFNGQRNDLNVTFNTKGYRVNQFQALIPLPYFNIGSERVDMGYRNASVFNAMQVSLQTGLPMATMMMARTSQSQALAQAQLLSSDLIEKSLLPLLPNQKPFLLMTTPGKLRPEEERLLQKSRFLFQADSLRFYELSLEALKQDARPAVVQKFMRDSSSLVKKGKLYLSREVPVVWQGLGNKKSGGIFGQGELRMKKGPLELFNAALPSTQDSLWEASVWVNAKSDRTLADLHLEQLDAEGKVLEKLSVHGGSSLEIFGSWVKIDLSFKRLSASQRVRIWLEGDDIWASSFLLKPADTDVYWPTSSQILLYNNYLVREENHRKIQ